jgi:hypothetical protein
MFNFGKKSLSLILTVVFVFALITACGKPAATPAAETAAETTSSETTSILDTLPKVNLEDITVRALARNDSWWQLTEISSEELNGEVINDAIYNRNLKLESHLRITFEVEHVDSVGTTIRSLISQHLRVVHLVNMIARKNQDILGIIFCDEIQILIYRIGGALVPIGSGSLIRWQYPCASDGTV